MQMFHKGLRLLYLSLPPSFLPLVQSPLHNIKISLCFLLQSLNCSPLAACLNGPWSALPVDLPSFLTLETETLQCLFSATPSTVSSRGHLLQSRGHLLLLHGDSQALLHSPVLESLGEERKQSSQMVLVFSSPVLSLRIMILWLTCQSPSRPSKTLLAFQTPLASS